MSSLQKRLGARILKTGHTHVWLDPTKIKDIEAAITKIDIRKMVQKGYIKVAREKVARPKVAGRRRKGAGSRKGSKYAIVSSKRRWMSTVRPLRAMLKELRAGKKIDHVTYRKLYMLVKGGTFRSRTHLRIYLEQHGILKKVESK
jgi:large subunit ribosomal protein L19e